MKGIQKQLDVSRFQKKDEKVCDTYWQEQAKQICDKFEIKGRWKVMIFQKAKKNIAELMDKVKQCDEKGINNGRYLIAMYRKK